MKNEKIGLWTSGEYNYAHAFGFVPNIRTYIHEPDESGFMFEKKNNRRPAVVVVPGGAYCYVSPSEGENVAIKFYEAGFNAFVLTYTVDPIISEPLKLQPLKDILRAIRVIRKNAAELEVAEDMITVAGFSAGGHLAASSCVHFMDIEEKNPLYKGISARPDSAVLSYPVITSGEKAHRGSFEALIGKDAASEELEYMSLEKQVTPDTPPVFLWHTDTDQAVPVENSYMFADSLKKNDVMYALHVFSHGGHGMSTADERWATGQYGEPYTLEQTKEAISAVKENKAAITEKRKKELFAGFDMSDEEQRLQRSKNTPDPEIAQWFTLALNWIKYNIEGRR